MSTTDTQARSMVRLLLKRIGDDPDRVGLRDTPDRIIRSWKELFSGYSQDPQEILKSNFHEDGYEEMILLKGTEFISFCEHHWLPIEGVAHVAYIPNGHIVGLSKLARLVEVFARRLQIQERMTVQIAQSLDKFVKNYGVAVVIEAKHGCVGCRGVRKQNSIMVTSKLMGAFRDKAETRAEFMAAIQKI